MTTLEKTKRDVERELALRSERIENAVARLKSDVSTPVPIVAQFVKKHAVGAGLAVVAVGALAGLLLARPKKGKRKKKTESDGVRTAYANAVAASIKAEEEGGVSREEAVRRAIESNPPIVVASSNSEAPGYLEQIGGRLIQALTPIVFDYASTWISQLVEGRRSAS